MVVYQHIVISYDQITAVYIHLVHVTRRSDAPSGPELTYFRKLKCLNFETSQCDAWIAAHILILVSKLIFFD